MGNLKLQMENTMNFNEKISSLIHELKNSGIWLDGQGIIYPLSGNLSQSTPLLFAIELFLAD